jgi:hypothetical protein
LQTEKESHVRGLTGFAFLQLAADRASRALIALAEEKSLHAVIESRRSLGWGK